MTNNMLKYTFYKFCVMIFTLWVIITSVFFIMKVLPGSPFDLEQELPQSVKVQLEQEYGLDQPVGIQYVKYLKSLLTFNLGQSYRFRGERVSKIIVGGVKYSFFIGFGSLFVAVWLGVILGVASVKKNFFVSKLVQFITTFGIASPNFILAIFFMYFFGEQLKLIPVGDVHAFMSYVGPILVLSVYPCAFIIKIVKETIPKVLNQQYVKAFEAYGMSKHKLLFKYALREVLTPLVTYIAPMVASIMMGSFAVEKIFLIPGLGTIFINSVVSRDYYIVFGLLLCYAVFYLLVVFLADVFYFIINPQVKSLFRLKNKI